MFPSSDEDKSDSEQFPDYDPKEEARPKPRTSDFKLFLQKYSVVLEFVVGFLCQIGFVVTWIWAIVLASRVGLRAVIFMVFLPGLSQAYWAYSAFGSVYSFICIGVALLILFSIFLSRISQSNHPRQ